MVDLHAALHNYVTFASTADCRFNRISAFLLDTFARKKSDDQASVLLVERRKVWIKILIKEAQLGFYYMFLKTLGLKLVTFCFLLYTWPSSPIPFKNITNLVSIPSL